MLNGRFFLPWKSSKLASMNIKPQIPGLTGLFTLFSALVLFFPPTAYPADGKALLKETFEACLDMGWLECDKHFYGENRGAFGIMIEAARNEKITPQFERFRNKFSAEECNNETLLNPSLRSTLSMSIDVKRLTEVDIKIETNRHGTVVYSFPNGDTIALVPNDSGHLIAIPDASQDLFKKTDNYNLWVVSRLINNIRLYHMMEANRKKLSCVEFTHRFNEAMAPVALLINKDSEDTGHIKKYLQRDMTEIAQSYFMLNTTERIMNKLNNESTP